MRDFFSAVVLAVVFGIAIFVLTSFVVGCFFYAVLRLTGG